MIEKQKITRAETDAIAKQLFMELRLDVIEEKNKEIKLLHEDNDKWKAFGMRVSDEIRGYKQEIESLKSQIVTQQRRLQDQMDLTSEAESKALKILLETESLRSEVTDGRLAKMELRLERNEWKRRAGKLFTFLDNVYYYDETDDSLFSQYCRQHEPEAADWFEGEK